MSGRTQHLYRAGTSVGFAGHLSTVCYRLFLDADSKPRDRPEKFKDKDLRRLKDL
ncbi:hypothetical protein [Paenarthrobacter aromaticivorans]|uniref:hypothetical protein n=1 Tax=Paenarthrobacter aromaticivorans TaxID=2849150 RepID=UPI003A80B172